MYKFTNNWFDQTARSMWDRIIPQLNPRKILEIGSYEGASACYLIDTLGSESGLEIHCVDSWEGGFEHADIDMHKVKNTFNDNIELAKSNAKTAVYMHVHNVLSEHALPALLDLYRSYFDLIYIDGSHQAPDVLFDAVNSFKLLKVGGLIIFDDYVWNRIDPINSPKIAIDAFVNIYCRKIELINAPLSQLYVQKSSE
jgi:predicted O-methyltransferase YrrM